MGEFAQSIKKMDEIFFLLEIKPFLKKFYDREKIQSFDPHFGRPLYLLYPSTPLFHCGQIRFKTIHFEKWRSWILQKTWQVVHSATLKRIWCILQWFCDIFSPTSKQLSPYCLTVFSFPLSNIIMQSISSLCKCTATQEGHGSKPCMLFNKLVSGCTTSSNCSLSEFH